MARPRLKIQRWREIVRRDSQIFFILHLRFQSKLFWLSTDFLSIYSEYYGTSISAKPGVMTELNAERALDLLNRSGNIPNFDVEIWNEERFQELREYSPLTNADAEISLWAEGLTWEERLIAIDGKVRNPSWRTPSDPFKFTILSKRIFADQEFPPRTVDEVKWPNARSSAIGQPYPVIYGFRSVVRSLCVDVPNKKELISDHACYSSPSRIYLKGYDDISRQEVFYSDGSSLSVFETSGSTWSTAGGIISFTSIVDQVGLAFILDVDSERIKSYNQVVRARFRFSVEPGTKSWVGFLVRYKDANNYYEITIRRNRNVGTAYVRFRVRQGGAYTTTIEQGIGTIGLNVWFELSVKVSGNDFLIFLDGALILEAKDPAFPAAGDTAIFVEHDTNSPFNAQAQVDWLRFPVQTPTYSMESDGEGNSVYVATFPDDLGDETEVWFEVSGKKDSSGALIENPIGVWQDILEDYSEIGDVDEIGFERGKTSLDGWKFSGTFQGSGSTGGTAFQTVESRFARQLPAIPSWIENVPTVEIVDFDKESVTLYLRENSNLIRIDGEISETEVERVVNVFTLKYAYDPIDGRFTKVVKRDSSNSSRCANSEARYGRRELAPVESYDIKDDATAALAIDRMVRTSTEVGRRFRAIATRESSYVEVNDLVLVTDSVQEWDDLRCLVEGVSMADDSVALNLFAIPD